MSLVWLDSSEVGREKRGGGLVGGRSVGRGQNLSHTDVGDGAWTWDWDWDWQTSEHSLELDVGERTIQVRASVRYVFMRCVRD